MEMCARHGQEDKIGEVKFANFAAYSQVYPDYRYVFIGDSGQADSITATRMVTDSSVEGTRRVLITFIHDLRRNPQDRVLASASFHKLDKRLMVTVNSEYPTGIIVFRNYIDAAAVAYAHAAKLQNLITAKELGQITLAALTELRAIPFSNGQGERERLFREYREDAGTALALMKKTRHMFRD